MSDTEHLRRVEFFLALVSFALIAAAATNPSRSLVRTTNELEAVDRILSNWDESWLDAEMRGVVADASEPANSWRVMQADRTVGHFVIRRRFCLRPSRDRPFEELWPHWMSEREPAGTMASPFGEVPVDRFAPPISFEGHSMPRPRTLDDFATFWDHLANLDFWRVDSIAPQTLFVYDSPYSGMPATILDQFEHSKSAASDTLDLCFRDAIGLVRPPPNVANWTERDSTWHFFHALKAPPGRKGCDPIRIALAAPAVRDSVNLRRRFIEAFGLPLQDRPFAGAFAELRDAARLYPTVPFDTLKTVIMDAIDRVGDDVQIVGARVPRASLAFLGIGAVLLVQLYYATCLRLLRGATPREDGIGWLGEQRSLLAQGLSAVGTVLLPVAASALTLRASAPAEITAFMPALLLCLASLGVGTWTLVMRWRRYRALQGTEMSPSS